MGGKKKEKTFNSGGDGGGSFIIKRKSGKDPLESFGPRQGKGTGVMGGRNFVDRIKKKQCQENRMIL